MRIHRFAVVVAAATALIAALSAPSVSACEGKSHDAAAAGQAPTVQAADSKEAVKPCCAGHVAGTPAAASEAKAPCAHAAAAAEAKATPCSHAAPAAQAAPVAGSVAPCAGKAEGKGCARKAQTVVAAEVPEKRVTDEKPQQE